MRCATALAISVHMLFWSTCSLSSKFTFEVCTAAENCQNTKTPYFEWSRSFKVIHVNTDEKLVTSMFVPICNCFHIRRGIIGKIPTF